MADNIKIAKLVIPYILETLEHGSLSITYGEISKRIEADYGIFVHPHLGLRDPLGVIQDFCKDFGAPCLSAVVIRADNSKPGGGFVDYYHGLYPHTIGMDTDEITSMELEKIRNYNHWQEFLDSLEIDYSYNGHAGGVLSPENAKTYYEYMVTKHSVENAELMLMRSADARRRCLELQGMSCKICGFNSMECYGIPGIIHVHHKNPVADAKGTREVDCETDLVPLCPNCHALVHSKKRNTVGGYPKEDVYSIEEAKAMYEAAQERQLSE